MYQKYIDKLLDVDHYQGQGNMIKLGCSVQFSKIIPYDTQKYPYIIWVCIGRHTHPPPDINKTPEYLRTGLINLIRRINDPVLTKSKFSSRYT